MLETLMEKQIIFYAMGVVAGIGVLSKIISQITLRRLVRAAGKMNQSKHKLMKLVKAKFEHASMISDKVQNVEAFVKKYVYEYRVLGMRLHTWQRLLKKSILTVGILGVIGTAMGGYLYGGEDIVFQYGIWTGVGVFALFLIQMSSDESYCLQMTENYMIDFLENTCAHRYEKMHRQQEISRENIVQMEETFQDESVEEEEKKEEEVIVNSDTDHISAREETQHDIKENSQEVRIRAILEEFLA